MDTERITSIFLDTSTLFRNFWLEKASLIDLRRWAIHVGARVLIPGVVAEDELPRKFREKLKESLQGPFAKTPFLRAVGRRRWDASKLERAEQVDERGVADSYRTFQFQELPLVVPAWPTPTISDAEIEARRNAGKKPFKFKGPGSTDTCPNDFLIWHTVLSASNRHGRVLFVSENTNDFGDGELHQDRLGHRGELFFTLDVCKHLPAASYRDQGGLCLFVDSIGRTEVLADH